MGVFVISFRKFDPMDRSGITTSILPDEITYFDWKHKENVRAQQTIRDTLNNVNNTDQRKDRHRAEKTLPDP